MQGLIKRLEAISEWSGMVVSWLTFFMVLATFVIVILRYVFDIGWIWMQESVTWMHALVLLVGAAYTLKHDEHVRVDVLYQSMKPDAKAWVNLLGTLILLIPTALFIFFSAWDFVAESWKVYERSREAGGLPAVYLLKSVIPLMAVLLMIQAVAMLLRAIATLRRDHS